MRKVQACRPAHQKWCLAAQPEGSFRVACCMSNSSGFHASEGALILCRSQEPPTSWTCQPLTPMPSCRPGLTQALLRAAARLTIKTSPLGAASANPKDTMKAVQRMYQHRAPKAAAAISPPPLGSSSTRFFPLHTYQHSTRPGVSRPSPFAMQQNSAHRIHPRRQTAQRAWPLLQLPGKTRKHPQPPCRQTAPDGPLGICPPQTAAVPWMGSGPGR